MVGLGTIINSIAIVVCSIVGLAVGKKIPRRLHDLFVRAVGLISIGIGIKMFLETRQILVILIGLLLGTAAGEWINIEGRLETLGKTLQRLVKMRSTTFLEGFVTTSLLYCVGPMAILGAVADGIHGQHDILFVKSVMDGVTAIAFSASLGAGVLFSSVPVLIYQGTITVIAVCLGSVFTTAMISDLTATGGLLIMAIGINLVGVFDGKKKLPLGNLLPAIFFGPLVGWVMQRLGYFF